jgi:hypothetical protein
MTKPSKRKGQIIAESARGKHNAWFLDSFGAADSHEQRFGAGDKQALLWEIYDSAEYRRLIPPWAATKFCDLLERVTACELSWDEAFGEVPTKEPAQRRGNYKPKIKKRGDDIIRVGEAVLSYKGAKDEAMWSILGKRLDLGRAVMKDCWRRYKLANDL